MTDTKIKGNKKLIIICIVLLCLSMISTTMFLNYYKEYRDLKRIIESELADTGKKENQKNLYERIILQYELMDFKIFAFEKKYAEFAKIVKKAFEEAGKNKLSPYTVLYILLGLVGIFIFVTLRFNKIVRP